MCDVDDAFADRIQCRHRPVHSQFESLDDPKGEHQHRALYIGTLQAMELVDFVGHRRHTVLESLSAILKRMQMCEICVKS